MCFGLFVCGYDGLCTLWEFVSNNHIIRYYKIWNAHLYILISESWCAEFGPESVAILFYIKTADFFASWGDLQSAVWPWGRVTLVVAKIGWLTTYNPASRIINKKKHIHVSWFKSCLKIAWYAYFRVSLIWFKTTLLIWVTMLQAEITPNYAGIWRWKLCATAANRANTWHGGPLASCLLIPP